MSLKALKPIEREKIIQEFYEKNRDKGKSYTVQHFCDNFGLNYELLYRVLRKIEKIEAGDPNVTLGRKVGSGGHNRALNRRQVKNFLSE